MEAKDDPEEGRPLGTHMHAAHWGRLPNPKEDGIKGFESGKHFCAVKTKKQLNTWWPKEKFKEHGKPDTGHIVILEIDPFYVLEGGKHQVVIERNKATIIGTVDPVTHRNKLWNKTSKPSSTIEKEESSQ